MKFAECLSDPTLQKFFIQYCVGQEGEESNVLFWLDAEDFRRRSGGGSSTQFQNLIEKYFSSGSRRELKLFDAAYQEKFRETNDPAVAVGEAQDTTFIHLEQQVYPQFVASPQYQDALTELQAANSATNSSSSSSSSSSTSSSPSSTTTPSTTTTSTTLTVETGEKPGMERLSTSPSNPSPRPSSDEFSPEGVLSKRSSVYNRYGQKVVGEAKSPESEDKKKKAASAVERSREAKWIRMLSSWQEFNSKNPRKLSSRIRKGIPDALRARAWGLMLGSEQPENEAKYKQLLQAVADSENRDVIDRDVNRTFSDYVFFRQKEGQSPSQGRESLRNVLRAYACHDKELGYCQGMSFHAGVFLMYATEEQAFWMLESLLRNPRWQLRGMFLPGFPLLNEYYFILESLMKEHTPKLRQKLLKFEVQTAMFAQEWFMTLFACCIPFESFLRVMDVLLYKGYKILFQLAIAMLKSIEQSKELPTMEFATLLLSLKGLGGRDKYRENTYAVMDTEQLLKNAFQIPIPTAKIDKLIQGARKST